MKQQVTYSKKTGLAPVILLAGLIITGVPAPSWGGGADIVIESGVRGQWSSHSPGSSPVARDHHMAAARRSQQEPKTWIVYLRELLSSIWGRTSSSTNPAVR